MIIMITVSGFYKPGKKFTLIFNLEMHTAFISNYSVYIKTTATLETLITKSVSNEQLKMPAEVNFIEINFSKDRCSNFGWYI